MATSPDFLTVEEAARVLRIGRTAAYLAAKRYRDDRRCRRASGRGDLRARCGCPGGWLEAMAGGPIDLDGPGGTGRATPSTGAPPRHAADALATVRSPEAKHRERDDRAQRSLPFTADRSCAHSRLPLRDPTKNGDALAPAVCCRLVRRRAAVGVGPC